MIEGVVVSQVVLLLASAALLGLAGLLYRDYEKPVTRSFSYLLVLLGATALCLGVTAATGTINKLIWLFTNLSIPLALLAFAFSYYGISLFRSRAQVAALVTPTILGLVGGTLIILGTPMESPGTEAPLGAIAGLPGVVFDVASTLDQVAAEPFTQTGSSRQSLLQPQTSTYGMNWRLLGIAIGVVVVVIVLLIAVFGVPFHLFFPPTETGAGAGLSADEIQHEVVADDLEVPWEVVPLDDDRYLVTERTGALLLIDNGDEHVIEQFDQLDDPLLGEGGLLGIALHPEFEQNSYLYVYQTVDSEGVENTVRRFELDTDDHELREETTIIDGIPSDRIHNGGRITFGPDDHLYITTGDANDAELAQDRDSLAGKILRLEDDGAVPADNPFDSPVYSYGHRNPQGLTWDDEGRLWSTEHGPTARDELNVIEPGQNYGWPTITGTETHPEMESPAFTSAEHETWAPAGAAYQDGSVFFAGLRGERLYEARTNDASVNAFVAHLFSDFGRLRGVTVGPDEEYLYVTTSNTDGRGEERANDDLLVRIPLEEFQTN